MLIRELVTKLGFKADDAKVKAFDGAVKGLTLSLAGVVAGAVAASAAALGLAVHASDVGNEIAKTARELGVAVDKLQVLRFAAERAGVGVETMNMSLRFAQKQLLNAASGTGPMADALKRLGISARDADGRLRNIGELMPELADKVAGMTSEAERAATMTEIFGRSGSKMALLLLEGSAGIDAYQQRLKDLGAIMSDDIAANAETFSDTMTDLNVLFSGLSLEIGGRLMPIFNDLIQGFIELMIPVRQALSAKLDVWFVALADTVTILANDMLALTEIVLDGVIALGGFRTVGSFVLDLLIALAAGSAVIMFNSLVGAIASATAAMWAFVAATATNPLFWIPIAIAGVVLLGKGIMDAMRGSDNWVKRLAVGAKRTLMGLFNWIKVAFKGMVSTVTSALPEWMQNLLKGGANGLNFTVQSSPMVSPFGAGGGVLNNQPVINQTINMGATATPQQVANTIAPRTAQAVASSNAPLYAMAGIA